ncbi:MAG: hypothetical protein HY360_13335 [Verrucomicrobia bacterium]|nr:hypothetical protein [Verrucomicrobiota bacterium]
MPADQAIVWATERTHTTRKGNVPGGLGLKLLREFIRLNEGKIQIVSDVGYWQQNGSDSRTAILPHAFPGTVVNIEINTADNRSYRLASEVKLDDIFQLNMKE